MAFDKTTIAGNALKSTQRIISACGSRLAGLSSNKGSTLITGKVSGSTDNEIHNQLGEDTI